MAHPHAPPVTSPLANPGQRKPVLFGDINCIPKARYLVVLNTAHLQPILTASAKHSYRFTKRGMQLMALLGKDKLLKRRVHPDNWVPPRDPST
ncbi:hypothetical protein PCANC_05656 [Puccinia coronata f. sp. avenae]|uniref:Uncharacterized protein n=1 Tax=Puccinia coronata f. sp. avenae TaxID=200324 RepID=A0A2N5UM88_9BASI|nr:hypothetical protein PCANC_15915 [Puccinia coronata f. sp. avenae]PLW54815.1 hypothetical protein PCANC_05656 [Puccinia coronata f. sp. avenae]